MFDPLITIVGSPERLEDPRKPKQPGTAVEYEYRCAEYEYEYDEHPTTAKFPSSSYSVRTADGTRNRTRTRCSSDKSSIFGTLITILLSPPYELESPSKHSTRN